MTSQPTLQKPVLPWVLAGITVLMQVAYPLTSGQTRTSLTIVTVVTFCLASTSHALFVRGLKWTAGYVAISVIGGWLIEYVGHTTDFPFGPYGYTTSLGWQLLGVPLVIPLAWSMMAYPALVVGQTMMRGRWSSILVSTVALASWDLFLDPMMVADGHWIWDRVGFTLPGIPGIPAVNFLGWFAVALVMMTLLSLLPRLDSSPIRDAQPLTLWLWTYFSSVLANAVFLSRPSVALVGAIVMGAVAIPLCLQLWRSRSVQAKA